MYEWRNANVTGNTRKAFEVANDIAWMLDDEKVRSAYILFAAMYDLNTAISKFFEDMFTYCVVDVDYLVSNKELFTEVFGEKAAERFFTEPKQEEATSIALTSEELGISQNDEIANKVIGVLNNLVERVAIEGYEGETQILEPHYSDKLEEACDMAYKICKQMGRDYIDIDTITYCILQNKETSAYKYLSGMLNEMEINIDEFINSIKISANITDYKEDENQPVVIPASLTTCLEVLNDKYTKGEICPILGRDKEIFKAFNVFSKKTKRNAVLVGYPGVGKTAIMEAVTQAIVNGTSPKEFKDYTVLSLDINSMVAGTKYRGEFETKVVALKQFLEHTPKIILFVDEMHQMLGAGGSSEGTVDLSGSLKPILSRDDVVFVGATTTNEYNQILSRDGAFKRRFEVITVKEPKTSEVKEMIKVKIKNMEKYHGVKMPKKYIDYIILCSTCFNPEMCNPDKTLDLCDRSMAIAKMRNAKSVTKADIEKVYNEFYDKYDKISQKDLELIAYHETGHYIVSRLTKLNKSREPIAISVVPGNNFLGVTIWEMNENHIVSDREEYETSIMCSLAGRAAESLVTKAFDSGAAADLKAAKETAKKLIAEYGLDDGKYKNVYLLDDDLFNEKMAAEIDEKANKLIQELYDKTEKFVNEHKEEITKMAKLLMKKKIVTSDELDVFLNT